MRKNNLTSLCAPTSSNDYASETLKMFINIYFIESFFLFFIFSTIYLQFLFLPQVYVHRKTLKHPIIQVNDLLSVSITQYPTTSMTRISITEEKKNKKKDLHIFSDLIVG